MNIMDFDFFEGAGAYVLVDGQFGSTGKGVLAGFLAVIGANKITRITTNAGPNSGHTAYYNKGDAEPIITRQLPVASAFLARMGHPRFETILNAGAVIDKGILRHELHTYLENYPIFVSRAAVTITGQDRKDDEETVQSIAGTGKGIGPAVARKVLRRGRLEHLAGPMAWDNEWDWQRDTVLVETAQGFSLGLNTTEFYPHVTSRECTVMQAIADARIPAQMVAKVVASYRTYPIRVGNTEGSSGDWYGDQSETSWEELGLKPELTTVTKRVRRIASWSREQFCAGVRANRPDVIFLNFCNYMNYYELGCLVDDIYTDYYDIMHKDPQMLYGWSEHWSDITFDLVEARCLNV